MTADTLSVCATCRERGYWLGGVEEAIHRAAFPTHLIVRGELRDGGWFQLDDFDWAAK